MNSLIAIHPYKTQGMWVFDDAAVGLREEPFVSGADTIIDHMVRDLPRAEDGFTLLFSATPFPGFALELEWLRADLSGNWYSAKSIGKAYNVISKVEWWARQITGWVFVLGGIYFSLKCVFEVL